MSKPISISSSPEFEKLISSTKVVVTDFYADWCGPCKAIAPVFESLSLAESKPGKVAFCKVDVDNQQEIARKYNVAAMPTFIIFERGSPGVTIRGANPGALRTAVKNAVATAGTSAFESKGRSLGSGNTVGGSSSGTRGGQSALPAMPFDISAITGAGILGALVRFIGLYFTTLFTLDPEDAAINSPFKSGADKSRQNKKRL